jgi:hypothetical protein
VFSTIGKSASAAVVDISCTGVRLRGRDLPPAGELLELTIEALRMFGFVAWSGGSECGVAFDGQLAAFEVEGLRRRCGSPALACLSPEERRALEEWILCVSR